MIAGELKRQVDKIRDTLWTAGVTSLVTIIENERNLFAVKHHLNLPSEEELRRELQRERLAIKNAMSLRALPENPVNPVNPV